MKRSIAYLSIVVTAAVALALLLNFFPRSKYSPLEKRELKQFPKFSWHDLWGGKFTSEVSSWYSDSEPYRDRFMTLSMLAKHAIEVPIPGDDEKIVFHAAESEEAKAPDQKNERDLEEYANNINANENAKLAHKGILVVGSGQNVRAIMTFGASEHAADGYAAVANKYKEIFGDKVNVYCMIIPTAIAFYCPDAAKKSTKSQRATIASLYSHLRDDVKAVDLYSELGRHAKEDIYLRTDHHWAPLGGYYGAKRFAEVAGVPFKTLSEGYEKHVVHGYVGSMYGYSKDIAVKNAPEDFVYYTPTGVNYTTTYTSYTIDKNYKVTGEKPPVKGEYFFKHSDGSSGAYCTFMGSDTKITKVETGTRNGRRLIILKDSFGNTLPGYLFYSFEEVHVIDFRYFTKNMKKYVADNKITDILFANNVVMACSVGGNYLKFLDQ